MLRATRRSKLQKSITLRRLCLGLNVIGLAAGLYLLLNAMAPIYIPQRTISEVTLQQTPEAAEDRLYIPKIAVDVAIVTGDSEKVLEKGAWHRQPQNGDPEKGGNFVLSAHRFELGLTPQQTSAKSPFYHIEKLKPGDKIFVDYKQKRHAYEVARTYKVDRFAVDIEKPSSDPKMTLYSCDLRGEEAGREVVEAKPIAP